MLFNGAEISSDNTGSTTEASWGSITGTLADQTDLKAALDSKANTSDIPTVSNDLTNELKTKYDKAVTDSHIHTNKNVLDKLSTSEAGKLLFDGAEISSDNTGSTTEASWGSITGNIEDQTDLKAALDAKANATDLESKADKADLDSKANTSDIPTVSNDLTNELKTKYDSAADNSHTHTNKDVLDKFSADNSGKVLYDGAEITSSTEASWGSITGTLADQTDLKAALDSKANTSDIPTVSNDLTNELKTKYDSAADNSHTHTNKDVLDKFSADNSGKVLYDGAEITSSTEASWGSITGNIEDQTDLKAALDAKANTSDIPTVSNDLTNELKTKYDSAADNSHTHTNKDTIDKLSTSEAGKLLFDGKEIESGSGSSSSGTEGFKCVASAYAHAEGCKTTANGNYSHAEGCETNASGENSHAAGYKTTASGNMSHAEGKDTIATGTGAHAEGYKTTASGFQSHAEGSGTSASANQSHAEGSYTIASNYSSHAGGHFSATMTTGGDSNNTTGTAFVIGNGTSTTGLSNAFSIQYDGTVKAKSTITASTAADYAEFFEWKDGNPDNEDRVGKFVTIDGNKILIASDPEDYILGIVSGRPFVLGNGDCDVWTNMHLTDEYNRYIMEPAPKMELDEETGEEKEVLDSEGNPVYYGTRPKLNPDYDPSKPYTSRFDRKEWAPIGMLGVLSVNQDGTCEVNGYARCNSNGIATACKRTDSGAYRVTEVLSDSIIKVILK